MMYYLYMFADTPTQQRPAGMNTLASSGMYLRPATAMARLRKHAKPKLFPSGKPTKWLGLYDNEGVLVETEEYKSC